MHKVVPLFLIYPVIFIMQDVFLCVQILTPIIPLNVFKILKPYNSYRSGFAYCKMYFCIYKNYQTQLNFPYCKVYMCGHINLK